MTDNHGVAVQHSDMDYAEHERTYALFTGLVKKTSIALVILLILLAYFTL